MKAVVQDRYGPPDVVELREIDRPTVKDNQVLVKVHVTTVNRTDCGFRAGSPFFVRVFTGLIRPKGTVLGNEFAGEVDAVGSRVRSFQVGDRVFGYSGLQHGSRLGAHAEYLAIAEDGSLATMPANLTFEEAGATGAIGSAAVQLLKHLGAEVTAVCDTKNVAGQRPGRRPGDRLHGRGLHQGLPDRPTTWSWMRWARAPSAAAGDC